MAALEIEALVDYMRPLKNKNQKTIKTVHPLLALFRPFVRNWAPAEAPVAVMVTNPTDRSDRLFLLVEADCDIVADMFAGCDLIDAGALASDWRRQIALVQLGVPLDQRGAMAEKDDPFRYSRRAALGKHEYHLQYRHHLRRRGVPFAVSCIVT